jgi:hypothetical protein
MSPMSNDREDCTRLDQRLRSIRRKRFSNTFREPSSSSVNFLHPRLQEPKPLRTTTTSNTSSSQHPLSHPKCNSLHFCYPHWQCSLYPQHQLQETVMGVEAVMVVEVVTAVEAVAPASLYVYPTYPQPSPKILTSCLHL